MFFSTKLPKLEPVVQLAATNVTDAASCSTSPGSSLRSQTVSTHNEKQLTLDFTATDSPKKRNAEILWALKYVESDWSASPAKQISNFFAKMFSDSQLASDFQLSGTKLTYLIHFGVAPYFRQLFVDEIKSSNFYSISFNQSNGQCCQILAHHQQ